ncbi:MAG: sulfotransferase [Flavobacteriales bacterium]
MKVIFLTGSGRSGTTLLQSMLNAHSEISFTPETHFIKRFVVPELSKKNDFDKEDVLKRLKNDKDIARLRIEPEKLIDNGSVRSTLDIFENIIEEYKKNENCNIVGDKDPMNIAYIEHLKKIAPDAFLLHIIRDPRDVLLSRMKSEWGKSTSFPFHLSEYKYYLQKARAQGKQLFGENYCEIFYENLVSAPLETMKMLCKRIGVDFEEAMIEHEGQAEKIIDKDEMSWKSNVLKPVMNKNIGKWKKELNKEKIALVEDVLDEEMTELGYEKSGYKKSIESYFSKILLPLYLYAFSKKAKKEAIPNG